MMTLHEAMRILIGIGTTLRMDEKEEIWLMFGKCTEKFFTVVCHEQQKTFEELVYAMLQTDIVLEKQSEELFQDIRATFIFGASRN